jgi:hypothetical protein
LSFHRIIGLLAGLLGVTAASTAALAADPNEGRRDRDGVERPREDRLRVGPLVGVGFPRPLAVEAFVKPSRLLGLGAEYSFAPAMTVHGADVRFDAIAADLRVFPFRGAFFIGARAGRQWLDARTTVNAGAYGSFRETMEARTWFFNPRIGFLITWESGVTLGIDAGVQLPIAPTYERDGPATRAGLASLTSVEATLETAAGALGNRVTPTVDLFRLGFLF